jgi:hypothetical protein
VKFGVFGMRSVLSPKRLLPRWNLALDAGCSSELPAARKLRVGKASSPTWSPGELRFKPTKPTKQTDKWGAK